ncbi:hypothetical protein BJY52DRAFT_560779 [Lactarius psammicola]|nr:hypothetical protein BJY52DRAFT_560779 [Lactarius psammicola]
MCSCLERSYRSRAGSRRVSFGGCISNLRVPRLPSSLCTYLRTNTLPSWFPSSCSGPSFFRQSRFDLPYCGVALFTPPTGLLVTLSCPSPLDVRRGTSAFRTWCSLTRWAVNVTTTRHLARHKCLSHYVVFDNFCQTLNVKFHLLKKAVKMSTIQRQ